MNSLDWSKHYSVLHVSRLMLRDQLGFTTEQVARLSDEDVTRIAEKLADKYVGEGYYEMLKFLVSLELADLRHDA